MYPYIAVGVSGSGSGPQSRFTPNSRSFLDGADAAPLLLVSVVVSPAIAHRNGVSGRHNLN